MSRAVGVILLVAVVAGVEDERVVLQTTDEYKCRKPIDYLEFGKDAQERRCNFREIDVTAASLEVYLDTRNAEDVSLGVRVAMSGIVEETFNGGYELELVHEDTKAKIRYAGKDEREDKGISFCCSFVDGGECAKNPETGLQEVTSCPTLTPASYSGSVSKPLHRPLKGHWLAQLYIKADSGSTIGRLTFEFGVTKKMLKRLKKHQKGTSLVSTNGTNTNTEL